MGGSWKFERKGQEIGPESKRVVAADPGTRTSRDSLSRSGPGLRDGVEPLMPQRHCSRCLVPLPAEWSTRRSTCEACWAAYNREWRRVRALRTRTCRCGAAIPRGSLNSYCTPCERERRERRFRRRRLCGCGAVIAAGRRHNICFDCARIYKQSRREAARREAARG
jgi:hypothetical protein